MFMAARAMDESAYFGALGFGCCCGCPDGLARHLQSLENVRCRMIRPRDECLPAPFHGAGLGCRLLFSMALSQFITFHWIREHCDHAQQVIKVRWLGFGYCGKCRRLKMVDVSE